MSHIFKTDCILTIIPILSGADGPKEHFLEKNKADLKGALQWKPLSSELGPQESITRLQGPSRTAEERMGNRRD